MALDMSFPRRPIVEAFLAGVWRNLTTDVRQKPAITITRGRKDWAAKPSPSLAKFTLDDTAGNYNPVNAMGVYHGFEFVNAPARIALEVGQDAFTRTVGSGWGTSPQNGAWSAATNGSATSSVSSNEGRHVVSATSTFQRNTLETIVVGDIEVRVSVTIDGVSNVTGGPLEPANIMLRSQNANADYYMCRMVVTTAEQVQLSIMLRDTTTVAGPVTLGTAYSGQQWRVAAHIEGGTIRFKAWPTSGLEPLDWQVTTIRSAPFGPGWPGIRSGVGSGNTNTPVTFRYDDLELRLPRLHGEVSKWDPSRDLGEVNKTVAVEVSGLARRLSNFKKPLRSSSYRYITTTDDFTLTDYWPLDELPDATVLGASYTGNTPAQFTRQDDGFGVLVGSIKWGAAGGLAGIERAPEIANGGLITLPINNTALGSSYSVSWVQKISADSGAFVFIQNTDIANTISFTFYTNATYEVYRRTTNPISPQLLFSGSFDAIAGYDDVWHTISLYSVNSGGQTDWWLSIDGATPTGTGVAVTYSPPSLVEFWLEIASREPGAFGQVVVSPTYNGDFANGLYRAAFGNTAEGAVERIVRLSEEEGVPYDYRGALGVVDPTATLVGVQRTRTYLELVDECVAVDRGSRYEPKGANAVAVRTVDSTLGQTPVVTLDYAAGEVAEPFKPITDDQGVVNDVTAKRPNGGEYRYERTVGPKNTADPGTQAGAVGRSDGDVDTNTATDLDLPGQAEWRVALGTVDAPRGPVHVDLTAPDVSAAQAALVMDVNIDDLLVVDNAQGAGLYLPYRALVRGYTETLDTAFLHRIAFNCTPAQPYDVFVLGESLLAGCTSKGTPSTLASGVDDNDTSLSVATTVNALWLTGAQSTPALLGGEEVTITNVTGTSSPQTFTVTRSVNGVVRSWGAGTAIEVLNPARLAPS